MTEAQKRVIDRLRAELPFAYDSTHKGGYELKKFEIEERPTYIAVNTVVGLKNDEGTAAAMLSRDNRLITIGPRGAVELLNAKKKSARRGWHNVLFAEREW